MKIQVASQDLKAAFKVASCAVGSEGEDVQTHFVFRASDKGKVEILSYSQRIFASSPLVCTVEGGPFSFTMRAKDIQKWVRALPDELLTLEFDQGTANVVAKASNATVPFGSLDPASFPYWDGELKDAKEISEIPAGAYREALIYARGFASKEDTQQPALCVVRVQDGVCMATDQTGVVKVTIPSLKGTSTLAHTKYLKGLTDYLGGLGTKPVKVLTHPRMTVYVGPDGEYFGESAHGLMFPDLSIDGNIQDQNWWEFNVKSMQSAIEALGATAKDDDQKIKFRLDPQANKIMMSMATRTGGESRFEVPCLGYGKEPDFDIYTDTFTLGKGHLLTILGLYTDATARLGVNYPGAKTKTGWVRQRRVVASPEGDCEFLAILLWLF